MMSKGTILVSLNNNCLNLMNKLCKMFVISIVDLWICSKTVQLVFYRNNKVAEFANLR